MSLKLLSRREGYLMIDHRASPGIPADIAVKMGLDPKLVAEGKLLESATLTCKHCAGVWQKNPHRIRARGYCRKCDAYICDDCDKRAAQPNYVHRCKEEVMDAAITAMHHGKTFDLSAPKAPLIVLP